MKKIFNTKDLVVYFDGINFHFGENQKEDLFVSEIETFGQYFTDKEVNHPLEFGKKSVVSLNDALIRTELTDEEVEFLEALLNRGNISVDKLKVCQTVFNAEVAPRLKSKKTLIDLKEVTQQLRTEENTSPEDEMV